MSNWERREINNLIPEKPEDYKRRFPKPFSSMIPADAGPDNKLATEAYVNSHSGGGGGGGSTADAVKYTSQSLTDAQKIQARTNIGAGTYDKPSSGIPASDLETGVIPDVSGKEDTSNKVTSLSAQSTNEQYPGAKAVVDYVDEHGGGDDEAKEVAAAGLCDLDKRIKDILTQVLTRSDVRDNLTSAAIAKPLSANQGVVLKKINDDNEEVLAAALCSLYALSAIPAAIAPPYSGSKTYALNDCVTHKTLFWRCTTPVSSPEMFDPNKWTQSSLYEEMLRLLNA